MWWWSSWSIHYHHHTHRYHHIVIWSSPSSDRPIITIIILSWSTIISWSDQHHYHIMYRDPTSITIILCQSDHLHHHIVICTLSSSYHDPVSITIISWPDHHHHHIVIWSSSSPYRDDSIIFIIISWSNNHHHHIVPVPNIITTTFQSHHHHNRDLNVTTRSQHWFHITLSRTYILPHLTSSLILMNHHNFIHNFISILNWPHPMSHSEYVYCIYTHSRSDYYYDIIELRTSNWITSIISYDLMFHVTTLYVWLNMYIFCEFIQK